MNKGVQADEDCDGTADGFIETPWGTRKLMLG